MVDFHRMFRVLVVGLTTAFLAACSGGDEPTSSSGGSSGNGSSSGGSSGNGSSSGGSSSGGSSSGGSSSGGSSSGGSSSGGSKKAYGAQCKASADCESDFCVFRSGGSLGMCTQTCEDDIDCPGLGSQCATLNDAPQKVCVPK
jgi:hypothetical protein